VQQPLLLLRQRDNRRRVRRLVRRFGDLPRQPQHALHERFDALAASDVTREMAINPIAVFFIIFDLEARSSFPERSRCATRLGRLHRRRRGNCAGTNVPLRTTRVSLPSPAVGSVAVVEPHVGRFRARCLVSM